MLFLLPARPRTFLPIFPVWATLNFGNYRVDSKGGMPWTASFFPILPSLGQYTRRLVSVYWFLVSFTVITIWSEKYFWGYSLW